MGLLDILNTDDGRFGLGLLAAAAPRTDGAGFGQRLNEAVGSVDQFKRQKLLAKLQELQMQEAEASMADKQAQRAQAQQMQELYKRFATPGQAGVPAIQGDAESGILPSAGQPAKPGGYDYQGLAGALAGINPMAALELQQKLVKQGPKFSTAPQYDQQGRAFILAEDGSMKYLDGVKARDKLEEVRLGDKVAFRSPYSSEMVGSLPIGQSPDSKASNAVAWANNAATLRGQDLANARARDANNIQHQASRTQVMQTPEGLIAIDKGTNQASPVTMGGAPIRSEDAMKKSANAKTVISLLDAADKLLPNSTGSTVGTGVDILAGFGGKATKGATAIAQLKTIEGQLIGNMPRMEGPQSDADRLLYQQAAGDLANPMKPVSIRQAASKTIRELQQRYTSGSAGGRNIDSLLDKYK